MSLRIAEALPPALPATATRTPSSKPTARLTILIVDDEPMLARAIARLLGAHDVTTETSSQRALERIRGGVRFDLVFSDLTMPDVDGFELLLTAEMLDHGLAGRIVIMSGGTSEETWRAIQEHGVRTIEKPFDATALRAILANVTPRER